MLDDGEVGNVMAFLRRLDEPYWRFWNGTAPKRGPRPHRQPGPLDRYMRAHPRTFVVVSAAGGAGGALAATLPTSHGGLYPYAVAAAIGVASGAASASRNRRR